MILIEKQIIKLKKYAVVDNQKVMIRDNLTVIYLAYDYIEYAIYNQV